MGFRAWTGWIPVECMCIGRDESPPNRRCDRGWKGMQKGSQNEQSPWVAATMGVELAGSIAAGALIGWLIDQWLGSAPRGVTIGAILGIVGGGLNFARQAINISRSSTGVTPPRKRVPPDADPPLPPLERRPEQNRAGRYDPRGPVDVLEDDDDDPEPRLPPDHDKW
ncbi:MAG: AtpZ/AtpI family protein [Phycisphaeraceae bacterium]|nr:MAG: AtpZ/AtpI family protein [Phycisphaeraceae bacterium]